MYFLYERNIEINQGEITVKANKSTKFSLTFIILYLVFFIISFFTNNTYAQNEELKIYSNACILLENKTGKIIYEKNADQKMYPASTTKILTAILTLERGHLLDKTTVSKSALAEMKSGYATAYLVEGEELTIEELLELLLIHSANDTSNVLAEYISGSIPEFVNLMNNKLQELGCNNTHFVTTNGLHDDNHYTNLKDMATITRYCMKNADFRRIIAMPNCHIKSTNKSGERLFRNTNSLILPTSIYYYPGCIGGKTGFTSQDKNCLVSACNKNNMQLIAIVFGASKTEDHKSARYVDSKTLYDYAYSNYSFKEIAKAYDVVKTIEIKNGTTDTKNLDLKLENSINAIVKNDFSENIIPEIVLNDKLSAPISQNSIVGKAIYTINGETYSTNLIASHNVEKDESLIFILRITLVILIIILFLIIIIVVFIKKFRDNTIEEATK